MSAVPGPGRGDDQQQPVIVERFEVRDAKAVEAPDAEFTRQQRAEPAGFADAVRAIAKEFEDGALPSSASRSSVGQ